MRMRSARSASWRPLFGRAGLVDVKASRLELEFDDSPEFLFVLNNQDALLHDWHLGRQKNPEHASLPELAFDGHCTAVFVDDLRYDCQPESDAVRLGREEGVEDVLNIVRLDSGAAVDYSNFN